VQKDEKEENQSVDSVNSRTTPSSILVVSRDDLSSEIISLREQKLCPNIERRRQVRAPSPDQTDEPRSQNVHWMLFSA
jgi:hypothetical protein